MAIKPGAGGGLPFGLALGCLRSCGDASRGVALPRIFRLSARKFLKRNYSERMAARTRRPGAGGLDARAVRQSLQRPCGFWRGSCFARRLVFSSHPPDFHELLL
jgi:hypothetical protein